MINTKTIDKKRIQKHIQKILHILDNCPGDEEAAGFREDVLCMQKRVLESGAEAPYEKQKKIIQKVKEEVDGPGRMALGDVLDFFPDDMLVHIHSSHGMQFAYTGDKTREVFRRLTCEEAKRYLVECEKNIGVHTVSMDMDYIGGNTERPVAILEVW